VSLVVKSGALVFILFLPTQYAIDLQLLGGLWILQTFPAIMLGLFTARLRADALLVGWAVGMIGGTWMSISTGLKPVFPLMIDGATYPIYIGVIAGTANLLVSISLSALLNVVGKAAALDETVAADYVLPRLPR
jgi:SSS family solute:Na+ symporter